MKSKRRSLRRGAKSGAKKRRGTPKLVIKSPSDILAEREREQKRLRAMFQALIETNPQEAARMAGVFLELSTDALLALNDSKDRYASEDSENIQCNHFRRIAGELEQLAKRGGYYPLAMAWNIAGHLAQVIHDLALEQPLNKDIKRNLVDIGGKSFFLPSLRSRNRKFTFDFEKVADVVQLSDFCVVKMDEESLARLDSPVTMFVAETLEGIERDRRKVQNVQHQLADRRFFALHRRNKLKDGERPNLAGVSEAELKKALRLDYPAEHIPWMLECLRLPDLNTDTVEQWTKVICAIVDNPETLKRLERTNLYRSLANGNDGKEYKMRDELKLRVKQALKSSLVPKPTDTPASRILRRIERKRTGKYPIKPGGL